MTEVEDGLGKFLTDAVIKPMTDIFKWMGSVGHTVSPIKSTAGDTPQVRNSNQHSSTNESTEQPSALSTLVGAISNTITMVVKTIWNLISTLLSFIYQVFNIIAILTGLHFWFMLLTSSVEIVTGMFNQIYAVMTMNLKAQKSVTAGIEDFYENLVKKYTITPVKDTFSGISAEITKQFSMVSEITSAITGIVGPFQQLGNAMEPFISALAPGLVEQFNYSMRILYATIGTALAPAFQVLSRTVRDVAGLIKPEMERLAPVLATLAQYAEQMLLPAIEQSLAALDYFTFGIVGFMNYIAPVFNSFRIIVTTIIKTLTPLVWEILGLVLHFSGLKAFVAGPLKLVGTSFEGFAKFLILLTARLALVFGITSYIDNLKKVLGDLGGNGQRPQGVAPAPEGVHTSGLEDIMRQMAEESVKAGGGPAPEDPQIAVMKDILDAVNKLQGEGWLKAIGDLINTAMLGLPEYIGKGIISSGETIKKIVVEGVLSGIDKLIPKFSWNPFGKKNV